jgi:hypothetical protein
MEKEKKYCIRCGILISEREHIENDGLCEYCSGNYNNKDGGRKTPGGYVA